MPNNKSGNLFTATRVFVYIQRYMHHAHMWVVVAHMITHTIWAHVRPRAHPLKHSLKPSIEIAYALPPPARRALSRNERLLVCSVFAPGAWVSLFKRVGEQTDARAHHMRICMRLCKHHERTHRGWRCTGCQQLRAIVQKKPKIWTNTIMDIWKHLNWEAKLTHLFSPIIIISTYQQTV